MRLLRNLGFVLVALAVLGAGVASLLWFAAARTIEAEVRAWAAQSGPAVAVKIGSVAVSGFPTRLVTTLEDVDIVSAVGPATYHTGRILVTRELRGGAISLLVPSPQTVTLESGTAFRISADRFGGSMSTRPGGSFGGVSLDATGLSIELPGQPLARAQRMTFEVTIPDAEGLVPSGTQASISLMSLTLPSQGNGPFGDTIQLLQAKFELEGAFATTALISSLLAWQPAGRVNLSDATVRWGSLDASPMWGILRLDRAMRPAGSIDVLFHDPRPAFEAMAAAGWADPKVLAPLINGTDFDPNRVLLKAYRVTLLDGKVVVDDIDMDHTAPVTLWTVPSPLARRAGLSEGR